MRSGKTRKRSRLSAMLPISEGAHEITGKRIRPQYLGSSDVLESLFGKYKDLADQAPSREITANVLTIPLLVTPLTPELLRQALETVREQDVEQWLENHLGPSPQRKKRVVLTAARGRTTKGDPEPA